MFDCFVVFCGGGGVIAKERSIYWGGYMMWNANIKKQLLKEIALKKMFFYTLFFGK